MANSGLKSNVLQRSRPRKTTLLNLKATSEVHEFILHFVKLFNLIYRKEKKIKTVPQKPTVALSIVTPKLDLPLLKTQVIMLK